MSEAAKNTILSLENISISFSRDYKKDGKELTESKEILKNISLKLDEGEIVALMGGNGSGKTTLFNIISGLLEADSGNIVFKGKDITFWKAYQRAKAGIGRMFQDNHIFPNITVLENMFISSNSTFGETPFVSLFSRKKSISTERQREQKADEILFEIFAGQSGTLLEKRNSLAGELSYGEKRLLGLARIFMGDYRLVLLDEPSAGINEQLTNNILEMVKKISNKNITVFLIEHEKTFVLDVSDRVIYLKNGKITRNAAPAIVLSEIG